MGDTFADKWQDELPEQIDCTISSKDGVEDKIVFYFDEVYNSKWDGNFYRYVRTDLDTNLLHRITIRSVSSIAKELYAEVELCNSGIMLDVRHLSLGFDKHGKIQQPARFDSLDAVIESAINKYRELLSFIVAFSPGEGWEGM